MQSFVVQRSIDAAVAEARAERRERPRMKMWTEDGAHRVTIPYAPREMEVDGLNRNWEQVDRPLRQPIMVQGSNELVSFSFSFLVARRDYTVSVEEILEKLRYIARSPQRVYLQFGPHEGQSAWRVTDFSYTVLMRRDYDNAVTRAQVDMELTQASDLKLSVGPVTGGKKPTGVKSGKSSSGGKEATARYYTVKSGDTLASISIKFYGSTKGSSKIADANNLRNPKNLKVGSRLRIP